MMKKTLSFLVCILSLFHFTATAQGHQSCDGLRYKQTIFSDVKVTPNLKFSEGKTINGADKELFLDIYEPKGDTASRRAVVILAFGGSFIEGDRLQLASICTEYAKKGYVAVSIDYRLYDKPLIPLPNTREMLDVVTKAMLDMDAAVSFLYEDATTANTYRIAPELFFVGGVSAGSITASNYAMLDYDDGFGAELQTALDANAEIDGISNENERIPLKGVVNFSGAVREAKIIDSEDPAIVSFHDRGDEVVPYGGTEIEIFGQKIIYVEGSYLIDSAAKAVGLKSQLYTTEGNGHVSYLAAPSTTVQVLNQSAEFMYEIICDELVSTAEIETTSRVMLYPNPVMNELHIDGLAYHNTVVVFDITGKKLSEDLVESDVHTITTNHLLPGMYYLKVVAEKENQTFKFQKL